MQSTDKNRSKKQQFLCVCLASHHITCQPIPRCSPIELEAVLVLDHDLRAHEPRPTGRWFRFQNRRIDPCVGGSHGRNCEEVPNNTHARTHTHTYTRTHTHNRNLLAREKGAQNNVLSTHIIQAGESIRVRVYACAGRDECLSSQAYTHAGA